MPRNPLTVNGKHKIKLRDYSPKSKGPFKSEKEAQAALDKAVKEIGELQELLYASRTHGVLMIFKGMDAAGKSSSIKCLMGEVNAHGCDVHGFKAPSAEELDHDYLWRCSKVLPRRGHIGIFDRSYYEEVVVVRVHPEFLDKQRIPKRARPKDIWKGRFEDIRSFERYLHREGFLVIKFFLNLSKSVQKKRLLKRLSKPRKNWKYSEQDMAERKYWPQYLRANEDAINHTSTPDAPWHILPSDNKLFARAIAAQIIVKKLRALKLKLPVMDKTEHAKNLRRFRKMLRQEKNGKKK